MSSLFKVSQDGELLECYMVGSHLLIPPVSFQAQCIISKRSSILDFNFRTDIQPKIFFLKNEKACYVMDKGIFNSAAEAPG